MSRNTITFTLSDGAQQINQESMLLEHVNRVIKEYTADGMRASPYHLQLMRCIGAHTTVGAVQLTDQKYQLTITVHGHSATIDVRPIFDPNTAFDAATYGTQVNARIALLDEAITSLKNPIFDIKFSVLTETKAEKVIQEITLAYFMNDSTFDPPTAITSFTLSYDGRTLIVDNTTRDPANTFEKIATDFLTAS